MTDTDTRRGRGWLLPAILGILLAGLLTVSLVLWLHDRPQSDDHVADVARQQAAFSVADPGTQGLVVHAPLAGDLCHRPIRRVPHQLHRVSAELGGILR